MQQQEILMEVRDICKTFGPTVALQRVNITVRRGEIRGLIGENGSGKSTVTSIYAGMQEADSGEMFFCSKVWEPHSMVYAINHGVGMIVQESGTVPDIFVYENMFLGESDAFRAFPRGPIRRNKMLRAAQEALNEIGASHISSAALTGELDMQDRKLVEIAKVWMKHPELMIIDETTTALSQHGREIVYHLMRRMRDSGRAVIFISHDMEEIMERCNALTVLRDGRIIRTFSRDEFDADLIRSSMIGRELEGSYYRDDEDNSHKGIPSVTAEAISYRDRIFDLSLVAHRGEILGIGGLSHCGMHTLGKLIYGALRPDHGKITVYDRNGENGETVRNERHAMQRGMGYVAKDRDTESLNMLTTIRDNVAIAGLDFIALHKTLILFSRERAYVEKNIGALSTKCQSIDQPVSELSGGNKQKVVFAKWIGRGSEILILDCPTRGVDIGVKQAMYRLMYRMKCDGKTIIMISEEMTELMGMCDRLLIMKDGRITKEFFRDDGYDDNEIIKYMI